MVKKVILEGVHYGVELERKGVTIRVDDQNNPEYGGRLRIGKRVRWTPAGKGNIAREKNWEQLIDFFMS